MKNIGDSVPLKVDIKQLRGNLTVRGGLELS